MSYSKKEIEQKRLEALQRKQNKSLLSNEQPGSTVPPVNNILSNKNKSLNATQSFGYRAKDQAGFKTKHGNNSYKSNTAFNKQKERFNPIQTQNFFSQKPRITAKCHMISSNRFTLNTSAYFPCLIESLKTIASRTYDMKSKEWNFLLKDYESLIEKLNLFKSELQIIGLPKKVIEIFRNNVTSDHSVNVDLSSVDHNLVDSLIPFQHQGVCYGISKGGRCMIADDMGLGKTIQALGIADYFKSDWPLLVVAPSSVRYHWADAINTFLPSVPAHYILIFGSAKDYIDNIKIVITSYDLLVRAIDQFERQAFGFVILDESHALKSIKTARFKAVQSVVKQARHVILLTGTPALSRPIELYSQINLIIPNFMRHQDFGIRYCAGEQSSFGWDFSGSSNTQELQLLLKHTCMIRRLKNEVLNRLPSKNREVIVLNSDLIKAGTKGMMEISNKLEETVLTGKERQNTLIQYYNESSFAKRKAVCDYVSKLFEQKKKCIIFAHHKNILDAICGVAEAMDIKYMRIDGRVSSERRKEEVDYFQTDDNCIAAVLSITAANSGITLTAAQLVVFAELFWNPGILCQAEDRVHRIGQDENVVIQYLVAKKTADDYIWPLIQKKINVLNKVGLEHHFSLKDINITKQSNAKQSTLDTFACSYKETDEIDENIVQSNKSDESLLQNAFPETSSAVSQEFKELLDLSGEDFCDWDDME